MKAKVWDEGLDVKVRVVLCAHAFIKTSFPEEENERCDVMGGGEGGSN